MAFRANTSENTIVRDQYYLKRLSESLRGALGTPAQRIIPLQDQDPKTYVNPFFQDGDSQQGSHELFQQSSHTPHPQQDASARPASTLGPLPPIKGTLRGKWKGNASDEWIAKGVQGEVDDLAKAVDTFAVIREGKLAEVRHATLEAETTLLRKKARDWEAQVSALELLLPSDNGDFNRLRQELKDLEDDVDIWYDRYQAAQGRVVLLEAENKALRSGTGNMQGGGGMGNAMNTNMMATQFNGADHVLVDMPGGPAEGAATMSAAAGSGGGASNQGSGIPPPFLVTPDAVLAAAHYLKNKGELSDFPPSVAGAYPDKRAVVLRMLLVLIALSGLAAAILLTHYLTKEYST